ncbi:MAG: PEGA domain-containing protein [Deltaproteobacteria bacterium]|nr:PEGA domain-containing protein [Deltaproteobacteria bacterium]
MKFSSSGLRRLAAYLALLSAWEWGTGAFPLPAAAIPPPEPALLLRYAAPSVPDAEARVWSARLPDLLAGTLRVRWVRPPQVDETPDQGKDRYPAADGPALARIAGILDEARRLAGRMDTKDAVRRLQEAEGEARRYRLSETTKPLLADIFLWRGALLLWDGKREEAEAMFARSRLLRPDFVPDPALFPPQIRESWNRALERRPPAAEVVVSTVPAAAEIRIDGAARGKTPARVRLPGDGPVTIRVERPGYRPVSRTGQWLPGDAEVLDIVLPPDRSAAIGEVLAASPDGRNAGAPVSELAGMSGAARAAVVVLEKKDGGILVRVLAWKRGDPALFKAGELTWGGGEEGIREAARGVSGMLAASGWPVAENEPGRGDRPWYYNWWFWGLIGAAVVGVATGFGGGGGGASGSSTGTIGVTF